MTKKHTLILLGLLIIVVAGGVSIWVLREWQGTLNQQLKVGAQGLKYSISSGVSFSQVAQDLAAKGVLEKPRYLVWAARWKGIANRIKAGEYLISPGKTAAELLDLFVQGKIVYHNITLVEGWSFRQVLDTVNAHQEILHTLEDLTDAEIMARLGFTGRYPEGRFLPETYSFPRGTTDVGFLRRAYQDMAFRLQAEWQQRDIGIPLRTPYEALILASIIEKETGRAEERAKIAGVFIRRLRKNMRLQTDPTVIYGLGANFDGNLRRRDLKQDTPYNTYVHKGLPPTPIAMPGIDAIRAVLHPEDGDELYFVAKGDGSHKFSATLKEHHRAVVKYQLKRRRK
ncbi:MAG: endolytic transglycosylase MltG [Gammaproteobacteria bacterium]|nr:endolytic transglycosylase MltG [Gammaproteobacteria bacterium]